MFHNIIYASIFLRVKDDSLDWDNSLRRLMKQIPFLQIIDRKGDI